MYLRHVLALQKARYNLGIIPVGNPHWHNGNNFQNVGANLWRYSANFVADAHLLQPLEPVQAFY